MFWACAMQGTDYSARAGTQYSGGMTSQVASALAAARSMDRSQHGPGDASIRYGRAHFAPSQEGFAQQFGPYAGAAPTPLNAVQPLNLDWHCTHATGSLWPHRVSRLCPTRLALASAVCRMILCWHAGHVCADLCSIPNVQRIGPACLKGGYFMQYNCLCEGAPVEEAGFPMQGL